MRHYLKLDPESTTLYFKEHQNSIKDKSTMKNALGYKFEKKKVEGEIDPAEKKRVDERRKEAERDFYGKKPSSKKNYNNF